MERLVAEFFVTRHAFRRGVENVDELFQRQRRLDVDEVVADHERAIE